MNYTETQIKDAWATLFEVSPELEHRLRRQPAQVIDFQRFKEERKICYRRPTTGEGEKHVRDEAVS